MDLVAGFTQSTPAHAPCCWQACMTSEELCPATFAVDATILLLARKDLCRADCRMADGHWDKMTKVG